jgi:hypothetical protein
MTVNKLRDTKYVDILTGEILNPVEMAVNGEYFITGFDKLNNFIEVVEAKDYYMYLAYISRKRISFENFLSKCSACGGDWVSMLFSGMRKVYPEIYRAIPGDKVFNIFELIDLLETCGVEL